MRIEIYNDETKIELDNVMFKDFNEETQYRKDLLSKIEMDFTSISKLKGEKTLMELAFQETKKELI
jgi:hypothetical protein